MKNNNNFIAILIINLVFTISFAQSKDTKPTLIEKTVIHSVKEYPSGIYKTYEDFINKKPTSTVSLKKMENVNLSYEYVPNDRIVNRIFLFQIYDDSKLTNAFAVSFEGDLYIKQAYLTKYAKAGNRNEEGDNPNMFHRVIKEGKFFYLEGEFANGWAKGFAYGSGGAVGGAIAANLNKLKGVVFDIENKEFDFIKNCKDFNLFLEENKINEKVECNERNINIEKVREVIDRIIK